MTFRMAFSFIFGIVLLLKFEISIININFVLLYPKQELFLKKMLKKQ